MELKHANEEVNEIGCLLRALGRHKDVLAAKIWVREDIGSALSLDDIERLGLPTPEDIDEVMEDGALKDYLQDCQDSEWDSIRESLITAMERRKANEREN